jgi:hypothetical protein
MRVSVIAALGAALAFPASSHGVVTIGSNLGRAPDTSFRSSTIPNRAAGVNVILPAAFQAPGGLTSPVNGVVTGWRVRSGESTGPTHLRVMRPLGDGQYLSAGRAGAVSAPNAITGPIPTGLPIRIGDAISLECIFGGCFNLVTSGAALAIGFSPPPFDGHSAAPNHSANTEIAVNADIEPTSEFTVERVQKLKKSRLRVTANLPNPGTLNVGDSRDAGIASAAAKRKKKKNLLQRRTATAAAPGQLTLVIPATKVARKKLKQKFQKTGNKKVKIGAKLKLAFTPTGGTAATDVTKTKLRR